MTVHVPALPFTLMEFVTAAYAAVFLGVVFVEVFPWTRQVRAVALATIALSCAGGAAWSYAAIYKRSEWPEFVAYRPADEDAGGGQSKSRAQASRGGDGAATADSGSGGGKASSGASSKSSNRGSGDDDVETDSDSAGAGSDGKAISSPIGSSAGDDLEGDEAEPIQDCADCPALLTVPAGVARIGADASDPLASDAEHPQHVVRIWPGFLISAQPVSQDSFERFLADTSRNHAPCSGDTADLNPASGTLPVEVTADGAASCVSPGEADAYVAWLTVRTGKRFRLPTATEWEYAARVLPRKGLGMEQVAEIVASCWQAHIPQPGFELIAAQTGGDDCDGRMLKGAGATEQSLWHRPSARRRIGSMDQRANAGFRVMRSFDGLR